MIIVTIKSPNSIEQRPYNALVLYSHLVRVKATGHTVLIHTTTGAVSTPTAIKPSTMVHMATPT